MPRPYRDDFAFLAEQQIALLVGLRLTPESDEVLQEHGLEYLHLPIEDFHPPTHEQQVAFVQAVEQRLSAGEKVGVHCTAGLGRTGTMLATWFVHQGMGPHEAIAHVRSERPGSIETVEQEEAVVRFADATR
jgi:atypical dual specificity phosphatase